MEEDAGCTRGKLVLVMECQSAFCCLLMPDQISHHILKLILTAVDLVCVKLGLNLNIRNKIAETNISLSLDMSYL